MKPAVIYCRVSGERDEKTASLTTQEQACREEAKKRGYSVIGAFHERHSGAELYERKILSDIREMIRGGQAKALLVYETDRLSRKQAHLWILAEEITGSGAELICVNEPFEDTPEGRFMLSVRGYLAEVEREKIRERTGRGRRAKIESGRLVGQGGSKYGYRFLTELRNGKQINAGIRRTEDSEAEIVRRIFNSAAAGGSTRQIAIGLNKDGVPTPSQSLGKTYKASHWSDAVVRAIIRDAAYTGKEVAGRVRVDPRTKERVKIPKDQLVILPDTTPQIVSEETWLRANQVIDSIRERCRTNNKKEFVTLRGMVVCGACGYGMTLQLSRHTTKSGEKTVYRFFRCRDGQKLRVKECRMPVIHERKLTDAVWDEFVQIIKKPKFWEDVRSRYTEDVLNQEQLQKDRAYHAGVIEECDAGMERLARQLAKGDIKDDEALRRVYSEYEERKVKHLQAIEEIDSRSDNLKGNLNKIVRLLISAEEIQEYQKIVDKLEKELIDKAKQIVVEGIGIAMDRIAAPEIRRKVLEGFNVRVVVLESGGRKGIPKFRLEIAGVEVSADEPEQKVCVAAASHLTKP